MKPQHRPAGSRTADADCTRRRWRILAGFAAAATVGGVVVLSKFLVASKRTRRLNNNKRFANGQAVIVPEVENATSADVLFAFRQSTPLKLRGCLPTIWYVQCLRAWFVA